MILSFVGQLDGVEVVWITTWSCHQRSWGCHGPVVQQDRKDSQGQKLEGCQSGHGQGWYFIMIKTKQYHFVAD